MNFNRFLPLIGTVVAFSALIFTSISIFTDFWSSTKSNQHQGLWRTCDGLNCTRQVDGRTSTLALTSFMTVGFGAVSILLVAILKLKSAGNNSLLRLGTLIAFVLLVSSNVLATMSIYSYVSPKIPTGYSFFLMVFAQTLSLFAALITGHWMAASFHAVISQ